MRTSPTMFNPLSAITRFPSLVGIMLRTTPPPPGIFQLWKTCVFGSKRTSAFGLVADSTYQIAPFEYVIAYGCDFGPLGDGHSVVVLVFGSNRPRYPRE